MNDCSNDYNQYNNQYNYQYNNQYNNQIYELSSNTHLKKIEFTHKFYLLVLLLKAAPESLGMERYYSYATKDKQVQV